MHLVVSFLALFLFIYTYKHIQIHPYTYTYIYFPYVIAIIDEYYVACFVTYYQYILEIYPYDTCWVLGGYLFLYVFIFQIF